MKEPTAKDMDAIFTRLANMGWIYEAGINESAALGNPFKIMPTPLGDIRLRELYRVLLALGMPEPSQGEWMALWFLVWAYGQKRGIPVQHESGPSN